MNQITFRTTDNVILLNGQPLDNVMSIKLEADWNGPNGGKVLATVQMFVTVDADVLASKICPKFLSLTDYMEYDLVPTADSIGWRHRLKCLLWWNPIYIPWLGIKRRIVRAVS